MNRFFQRLINVPNFTIPVKERVKFISQLYSRYGNDGYTIGEHMTQRQHAIGTWYDLKEKRARRSLRVAGALHDIAHPISYFMDLSGKDKYGCHRHERVGSLLVSKLGFDGEVSMLIDMHVDAKRYQQTIERTDLSEASEATLVQQGGTMILTERYLFENNKYFDDALKLRNSDDGSKDSDVMYMNENELDKIWEELEEDLTLALFERSIRLD